MTGVLKARVTKLENGRKVLSRLIDGEYGRIVSNNPEKKYRKIQPDLDALQHYSHSQFSVDNQSQKLFTPARALPRLSLSLPEGAQQQKGLKMDQQSILAQRARKFVNRLRKQKQYQYGRAVLHRKKQEQARDRRKKQDQKARKRFDSLIREQRADMIIDNILYHEERISSRMRNSINRYRQSRLRSHTEGLEQASVGSRSAMFDYEGLPIIASLKQRLANLSSVVDSLSA